jgi:hypothetical protein
VSIEYVDPRSGPAAPVRPYTLAVDVTGGGTTIGLIANGFPDSVRFLDHIERALAAAVPSAALRRYAKNDVSVPATADMRSRILAECGAVIGAYGH